MEHSLTGWDIANAADVDWAPWGIRGDARAKLMASADGYNVVLVVAEPGYAADPHVHGFPEFVYVVDGTIHVQGYPSHAVMRTPLPRARSTRSSERTPAPRTCRSSNSDHAGAHGPHGRGRRMSGT
jgi:hypothetical protein